MSIYKKLAAIQKDLKAPKSQFNDFGKYNYRNLEDILGGLKPLLDDQGCTLIITDDLAYIGDRYYIKATVTLIDIEDDKQQISNTAFAREALIKRGMDESQITGTASSYARKYACCALFTLDDTRDADSQKPLTIEEQIDQCPDLQTLVALHETLPNTDKENLKSKFTEKRGSFI